MDLDLLDIPWDFLIGCVVGALVALLYSTLWRRRLRCLNCGRRYVSSRKWARYYSGDDY